MSRPFPHRDSTFPHPDSAYFAPDAPRQPPISTAPMVSYALARPSPLVLDASSRAFVAQCVANLNAKRTGRPSDDDWIEYALRQWRAFLAGN